MSRDEWRAGQSRDSTVFQGRHKLGEIQLLIDLDQKMVGIKEVPQLSTGELEEGGVPSAPVPRLEHPHSSQLMDCSPILAQDHPGPGLLPTFPQAHLGAVDTPTTLFGTSWSAEMENAGL